MKYNCLIVDDERPALKLLAAYISKLPHLNLVDSCDQAMQAVATLQEKNIDLLFLDIQMPELTGLELLKVLKDKPQVILTTAYREFAVEGFALDVTDYLVKPFSFERFVKAVNKATEQINLFANLKTQNTSEELPKAQIIHKGYFFVRTNHKIEKIILSEILYVESMREYIAIHIKDKRIVIHKSMNAIQDDLPFSKFIRVHRSFIVSLDFIDNIQGNMIVIGEKKIPIGPSYRKAFFDQINQI